MTDTIEWLEHFFCERLPPVMGRSENWRHQFTLAFNMKNLYNKFLTIGNKLTYKDSTCRKEINESTMELCHRRIDRIMRS